MAKTNVPSAHFPHEKTDALRPKRKDLSRILHATDPGTQALDLIVQTPNSSPLRQPEP